MASCDDDFPLLADDGQSQHRPLQQVTPFGPPSAHRYLTKGIPIPLQSRPHNQIAAAGGSGKKGVGGGDPGGPDDHEDYGEAFGQVVVSKCPTGAPAFHDHHHHCFAADETDPYGSQHPQGGPGEEEEDDEADNNPDPKSLGAAATTSASLHHHHSTPSKRRDRDDLSDGESPYCYDSSGPVATGKRSKQMSTGDYRKDREEWSDTAIGSLLDVYTERYVQLNRGNLRGRDWEDVAIIVSKRSDKQKAAKSVEQCKNKIDNLKKRYKVECQRLNSGGHQTSHWPWFKKMEQIVGSSSSTKAAQEEEKSATMGGTAMVMRQMKRFSGASSSPPTLSNNSKVKSLQNSRWKRVVLRISGALLAGTGPQNVDPKVIMQIAKEIAMANRSGIEVAVVIGGRNFFYGDSWVAETGIDRASTYQIGMMASVMNAMMLQASLEKYGIETRIQSTLMMQDIAEPYIRRRAIRHLEKGRVVIFGGAGAGTGNPLFSTDATAALRASEIHADVVLKGTTANCVYDNHIRNSNVGSFEHISYAELISRGFTAMDVTALRLCEENNIPVVLFNISEPGNVSKALSGEQVGTLIDHLGRIS